VRLFVATLLHDDLRDAVAAVQRAIARAWPASDRAVKWVEPENFHFTLKFLGEVPEEEIPAVAQAVRGAALGGPFEIAVEGVGVFPSLRNPRVLWIGVGEGRDRLRVLAHRVEEALVRVGFPREGRPFEPHLTIGRVREGRDVRGLGPALEGVRDAKIGRQRVGSVVVMTSRLGPRGPSYSPREVIALDG
jgi:2'-5' RNA ligase